MFRLAVVAGLVAYAAAQSISPQCLNALATIGSNKDAAQCLAVDKIIPLITVRGTSLVGPLNTWLVSMCPVTCSDATIAAVAANLTTGCPELNISSNAIQTLYPALHKILCLKNGTTLCVTETLTNVETVTGPLNLTSISKLVQNPLTTLPTNITCTNCNKATYSVLVSDIPSAASSAKSTLESQCGASFVDGSTPSGISQSANTAVNSSSTSTNSAYSLFDTLTNSIVAVGASSFIALSTVFTILI